MIKNNGSLTEQIFSEYKPRIYGYIHSKGVPASDADDVFGEIIAKAAAYAGSYDSEKSSLSTWLYTVCRSVVVNYFKKQRPQRPLTDDLPSDLNVEQKVETEEELRELAHQLKRLPDRERKVIILRFYRDMDYREIAQAMGLSAGNVRVIYSRAIKNLKEWMGGSSK